MASTLRRRMIVSLGIMVLGSLAIGVGAIIAISRLHQNLGVAVQGYRQLRQLYDAGFLASKAREAITANPPQPALAQQALLAAQSKLNERSSDTDAGVNAPMQWVDESARRDCLVLVSQALKEIDAGSQSVPSLNLLFARTSKISGDVRQSIVDAQAAADHQNKISLWFIVGLCAVVLLTAIAIGIRQYQRVIGPIRQIGGGARAFAKGDFHRHIILEADREFVALADDFNHMADELAALYRDLEQKVQAKTQELVRSEQLASVGYLAAGVAHEINNPLGIIAGYAERTAGLLSDELDAQSLPRARKALAIIGEEAFRCKQITDRLLSMARPTTESRGIVSIATIAETIVSTLAGLGTVGEKKLLLQSQPGEDLILFANEGEMKQMLMNLIINGLEAVDPVIGRVEIDIGRNDDVIRLNVTDNGEGMTGETIGRIFQPFVSDKRGQKRGQRHGTGLGLSITHAIVTGHGGRIWAESAGLKMGSVFRVELPAAKKETAIVVV